MVNEKSGYYLKNDWSLNEDDPVIAGEVAGQTPSSIYTYFAGALKRRVEAHGHPLNILCCDNIRSNGHMLEANLLAYLKAIGAEELHDWARENVSFHCSMVDRITPRASDELAAEIADLFPSEDLSTIHGESYIQWVLEDKLQKPRCLTWCGPV